MIFEPLILWRCGLSWCFSCGLRLDCVSLCRELSLQRLGVASLVGWSSGLLHTCSSSSHQRHFKYSGLPSTWWQIVSTHSHWYWLLNNSYLSLVFSALVTLCLNCRSNFLKSFHRSPLSSGSTAATRQTPLWTHLRLTHLCPLLSLYLPVASATPPAASLAWAVIYNFFAWTNQYIP